MRTLLSISVGILTVLLASVSGQARMHHSLLLEATTIVPAPLVSTKPAGQGWAKTWLAARAQVRAGRKSEALKLYTDLLNMRPELIEARWEYSRLLAELGRLVAAEENLEILLETDPDNFAYQRALGSLLVARDQRERAAVYLAKAWQADQESFELGMELYQTYRALADKKNGLPVLETLHRQRPNDVELQQALFQLYVDLGLDQQAQPLGASLANSGDASFDLLQTVAQVHDRLGLSHLAAEYWQRMIVLRPNYSPAHSHLAEYYSQQGRGAEALPHLLHGYGRNPADDRLAGRIGTIYAEQNNHGRAIDFLSQYVAAYPDDATKNLLLARSYQAHGLLNKSSIFFSHYLELVPNPDEEIRLEAAQVFSEIGQRKKALAQYQQLAATGDMKGKYLAEMARNLAASGQLDKALRRWQQVAAARPDDVESRLEIVALLEKMGREDDKVAMLESIHALDAGNHLVSLKLADYYFRQGRRQEGWHFFRPLAETEFFSVDFLVTRARIFRFLGLTEHAFNDMTEVVAKEHVTADNRLTYLDIAGAVGRLDIVREQATALANSALFLQPAGRLIYARALGQAGAMAQAEQVYSELLLEADSATRLRIRLDSGDMYRLYGLPYEAEQQYRLAWFAGYDERALFKLVDLSLQDGRVRQAESWLDAISGQSAADRCQRALYELRVLNGLEEFDDALLLAQQLLAGSGRDQCAEGRLAEVELQMARAHFGEGDDELALPILTSLVAQYPHDFAAHAELFYFHREMGNEQKAKKVLAELLALAGEDAGLLASSMATAQQRQLFSLASALGRRLNDKIPLSFGFLLRSIRALELNGELDEAESLAEELLANHGDNVLLTLFGARLALSLGHYDRGVQLAGRTLAIKPQWPAALVVKARLEWALFHWPEAIAIYQKATTPSAEQKFLAACAEKGIALPPHEELSLWMKVIQPMGRPGPLQRSLGVDFVMTGSYGQVARQAAHFYALYHWQRSINRELAARRSVQRREYYHAVKQYEALLRDQTEPTLLFDLAGVYSSLDRVGDEGVVYQRLHNYSPDFPGLTEAMARNHLKRRPQSGILFGYEQKKGRDGYYDLKRQEFGLSGWLSPRPQREIRVGVSRLRYQSLRWDNDHYGKQADIFLASNFFDHLQFKATLGGHDLSGGHGSVGFYDFSATGLAGDRFESYIGIKRQVVTDTLASVMRGIMAHVYEARAELDLMPRLQAGGELRRTEYSDENEVNGYSIWISSMLLPEPHFLKATFLYEFLDAKEDNEVSGPLLPDGFAADDHPYWSPQHYWRNQFEIKYKHKFSDDVLGRSTPSFFTAGYGFTYDVDEDTLQVFQAGLHVEMSRAWLVRFDSKFTEGDEYRTRDIFATLQYRW